MKNIFLSCEEAKIDKLVSKKKRNYVMFLVCTDFPSRKRLIGWFGSANKLNLIASEAPTAKPMTSLFSELWFGRWVLCCRDEKHPIFTDFNRLCASRYDQWLDSQILSQEYCAIRPRVWAITKPRLLCLQALTYLVRPKRIVLDQNLALLPRRWRQF